MILFLASNLSTSAMLAHNSVQGEQTPGDVPPVWWSSGVPAKPAKQYQPVWLNSAKSASPKVLQVSFGFFFMSAVDVHMYTVAFFG